MKRIKITTRLFLAMTWMILASASPCLAVEELTLTDAWQIIKTKRFVDLTHASSSGIPHWKGSPVRSERSFTVMNRVRGHWAVAFMYSPSLTLASGELMRILPLTSYRVRTGYAHRGPD
jgi:hypothetical protein